MSLIARWLAVPLVARWVIGTGALLGAVLIVGGLLFGDNVFASIFMGFVFGGPLVIVGVCAIRRPKEMPRVFGAFGGALSAPLYLPLLPMMHPNDSGADLGRAMVAFLLLVAVPVNMAIGARLGEQLYRPWWADNELAGKVRVTPPSTYWLARSLGSVVAAVGLLILWQASQELSPDPEIARWEFVHHGVLPAIPMLFLGVCTAMLPSRLPIMCGAIVGLYPALACSSLLVDPNPDDHGQTPAALVAYSLPLTLPFTVGIGGLIGNSLHRRVAGAGR